MRGLEPDPELEQRFTAHLVASWRRGAYPHRVLLYFLLYYGLFAAVTKMRAEIGPPTHELGSMATTRMVVEQKDTSQADLTFTYGEVRKRPVVTMRCAVYTRKSTEEGLDKEFNSLDAQRDACELTPGSHGRGPLVTPIRFMVGAKAYLHPDRSRRL